MTQTLKQLYVPKNLPMKVAAFMSGTGSIVRKILEFQKHDLFNEKGQSKNGELFRVVMIFTDTADETVCNARKIAEEYKVAYYCSDIKAYYKSRGFSDKKDMKIRQEYDAETVKLLRMHKVNVVALCGYMSIVTKPVIESFLTINVHPADLRAKDSDGKRKYAGCMGPECVKKAILNGDTEIRATTHLVSEQVDGGQLLLVSKPVRLYVDGSYGSDEQLERISHEYQQKLKEEGDWKVYPETIRMLAEGRFALDEEEGMVYLDGKQIADGHEIR